MADIPRDRLMAALMIMWLDVDKPVYVTGRKLNLWKESV
jgi:hypothetical protein